MPEGVNLEVAQHLNEKGAESHEAEENWHIDILEVVEALMLALVTIVTAWSGYQAAQWDGNSALYYGQASSIHLLASRQSTLSGQQLLFDANTFNAWGAASIDGNTRLTTFYAKRFTPAYRVAFHAWLKTDPAHNPKAPPGPAYMPQYDNPAGAQARRLDDKASATFQRGTDARETGDKYVRITVLLASILFLVAIGQRFKVTILRRMLLGVGFVLLVFALVALTTYPRA